jgi:Carboxypeptidase regulatory-like domain
VITIVSFIMSQHRHTIGAFAPRLRRGSWLLAGATVLLARPAAPQNPSLTLRGVVVDSASLQSLAGVEVRLTPSGPTAVTDESGAFALEGVQPGDYVLAIAALGFDSVQFTLSVAADQHDDLDVGLIPLRPAAMVDIRLLGAVVDGDTREGVPGAEMYIDDYYVGAVNTYGAFDFPLQASPGIHQVRIRRVGYVVGEYQLEVDGPGRVEFEFELHPLPTALEEIVVSAPEAARGKLAGFFRRRQQEHGQFMTPEEVEALRSRSQNASDIILRLPGVRATPTASGRRLELQRCGQPVYYLDGHQYDTEYIDDALGVDDIEAIEVYDGVTRLPLEFNKAPMGVGSSPGSSCGAIVIWTRSP